MNDGENSERQSVDRPGPDLEELAKPYDFAVKLAARIADGAPEAYKAATYEKMLAQFAAEASRFGRESVRPVLAQAGPTVSASRASPLQSAPRNEGAPLAESLDADPELVASYAERLGDEKLGAVVRIYGVLSLAKAIGRQWITPNEVVYIAERLKLGIAPNTIRNRIAEAKAGEVGRRTENGKTMYTLLSAGEKAFEGASKNKDKDSE